MSELFPPPPLRDGPILPLAELLQPGAKNDAWRDFYPDGWWWCRFCFCVSQEKDLLCDLYEELGPIVYCPQCDNAIDDMLYWYHGWPSRVLVGWVPLPESGQKFPLPYEPSQPVPIVKRGKNSHHPPLQGKPSWGERGAKHPPG